MFWPQTEPEVLMNKVFFKTLVSDAAEWGFQRHNSVFMVPEKKGTAEQFDRARETVSKPTYK